MRWTPSSAHDPAGALRAAAALTDSGRDPGQILRDLEVHARELMAVQVLGEVIEELRVTPERDQRLLAQSHSLAPTDVVRLLDLVAAALQATANGAQARIQLELVLVKAAAPEVDPSAAALLARIGRLESALRVGTGPGRAGNSPPRVADSRAEAEVEATIGIARETGPEPQDEYAGPAAVEPSPPSPDSPPSPQAESEPATTAGKQAAPPRGVAQSTNGGVDVDVDLELVRAYWPTAIEIVREENQMLAALLADAQPVSLHDDTVTIAFPSGSAFLKRKAEQDDHRQATAAALASVVGSPLALRYELRDVAPAPEPEVSGLSGEEVVRRLMEEFDAQEVLDDPDEEGG